MDIFVEIGVYDVYEGYFFKIEKIVLGESWLVLVGVVYLKSLFVCFDFGFGYGWSNDMLWWRDLFKWLIKMMVCKGDYVELFYFQMFVCFDKVNFMIRYVVLVFVFL